MRIATANWIERVQLDNGAIPWDGRGHVDAWNHIEAAMGLDAAGRHEGAERAYEWLRRTQRLDGAWLGSIRDGKVIDATLDANFTAYVAAGVWHHWLATSDESFVERLWPAVELAVDFVLELQSADGSIFWARDAHYRPWPRALLTSSSCIHLSLDCAMALAELRGVQRPDWELARLALRSCIEDNPAVFEPKERFSMDWYYPILGGVLRGDAGLARIEARWHEFVEPNLGARCVADRPWITAAETCELVLTLHCLGLTDEAAEMFDWIQYLRAPDGAYWTGATFPDGTIWPREQTTWSAGAVLLADDVLEGRSPTARFFADAGASTSEAFGVHAP